jgi:hypothetical protein
MRLRFAVSGRADGESNEGDGAAGDDTSAGDETKAQVASGN